MRSPYPYRRRFGPVQNPMSQAPRKRALVVKLAGGYPQYDGPTSSKVGEGDGAQAPLD